MSFIVIEGNVTADATLREFTFKRSNQSVPISNASIAVNDRRYNNETDTWENTGTTFYEPSATKGARMLIAGQLYTEDYTDSDGATRSRRRVTVDHHGLSTRYAPTVVRDMRR